MEAKEDQEILDNKTKEVSKDVIQTNIDFLTQKVENLSMEESSDKKSENASMRGNSFNSEIEKSSLLNDQMMNMTSQTYQNIEETI